MESWLSEMPFQNISFLFWLRKKELAELKQQAATIKAAIAKEEAKKAELKRKVHLGLAEAEEQVHAEMKARGLSIHKCVLQAHPSGK